MTSSSLRILYFVVAMLALVAGMVFKSLIPSVQQAETTVLPSYRLPDLTGQQQDLASAWQGKVRVINFWATWCPPCRKEIPSLIALHTAHAANNVVVIGVAIDEPQAVADFAKETGINYSILIATHDGEALARQLGNVINAVPFTVVVDRQGQIVHRQPGEMDQAKLEALIKPLL